MTSTARQLRQPLTIEAIERVPYFADADTHFYNNIRYFYNFKPSIFIATAGDSGAEIHKYGNINLVIKVGK